MTGEVVPLAQSAPDADVRIDAALVATLLAEQAPDLVGLPLRAVDSGWDNVMYRLGDDLAVRLPRRALGATLIGGEQRVLPRLAPSLPIEVPVPVHVGEPGHGYPYGWSVVRWVDGDPLDDDVLPLADADRLVEVLGALHGIEDPPVEDAPGNAHRGIPLGGRAQGVDERLTVAGARTHLGRSDQARLRTRFEACLGAPAGAVRAWLHGDLHPRNLVVRDGRLAGIVDWGDVTAGDPATDLAVFWLAFDDPAARRRAREHWDAATWERGVGWGIVFALNLVAAHDGTDELLHRIGQAGLARILAES